jgi:hypothetical protein
VNNNADENDSDSSTANTAKQVSLLLANDLLEQPVSQVQLPADRWELSYIFKLFVVLVHPPPDTDLDAIEDLPCYLTQLLVEIRSLANNGTDKIICHCWCALQCKHFTPNLLQLLFLHFTVLCNDSNKLHKHADWVPMLRMLKRAKRGLSTGACPFPFQPRVYFQSHTRPSRIW